MSTTTIEIEVAGIDMEVEFNYSAFVQGNYSGIVDTCYPDEPEELEIHAVRCPTTNGEWVDLLEVLSTETLERLETIIREMAGDYD